MWQDGRHPRFVEAEQLSVGHLARRPGELATASTCDISSDVHVIGLASRTEASPSSNRYAASDTVGHRLLITRS
jgi:hypothetical protein